MVIDNLRSSLMLMGLVMVVVASFGFAIYRTVIGTRMVKAKHPDLYIDGLDIMSRADKKKLYNQVTRRHAMAGHGKALAALGLLGFAVFLVAALLPKE